MKWRPREDDQVPVKCRTSLKEPIRHNVSKRLSTSHESVQFSTLHRWLQSECRLASAKYIKRFPSEVIPEVPENKESAPDCSRQDPKFGSSSDRSHSRCQPKASENQHKLLNACRALIITANNIGWISWSLFSYFYFRYDRCAHFLNGKQWCKADTTTW